MSQTLELQNDFACLNLSADLLKQVQRLGFQTPTPIQRESIPHGVAGRDVVGIAQTGTGKTLAFGLPMLQRLWENDGVGLILAPTRELALQINEELHKVGGSLGLRTAVLIGGAPMGRQVSELRRRPNIIVATPGRLMDHLAQRTATLKFVTMVVLDEADRMFDMGFAPVVHKILDEVPSERQTMLYSATMAPEVANLSAKYLNNPVRVEVAPQGTASELVEQELHVVEKEAKSHLLEQLLDAHDGTILVFSRTRHGARKVARNVRQMGHTAAELHSDRTLAQRKTALQGFKSGEYRVLVATDIAARGIDVKEINVVINYDLPDQLEDYIHRIGRTGRAGANGRAITFAQPDQHRDVRQLEKLLGRELPVMSGTLPAAPVVHRPRQNPPRPRSGEGQGERDANRAHRQRPRPNNGPRPERPTGNGPRPERPNNGPRPERPANNRPERPAPRPERPAGNAKPERPAQPNPNRGWNRQSNPNKGKPGTHKKRR